MEKSYPKAHWQLQQLSRRLGKEIEGPMAALAKLRETAIADGALTARTAGRPPWCTRAKRWQRWSSSKP